MRSYDHEKESDQGLLFRAMLDVSTKADFACGNPECEMEDPDGEFVFRVAEGRQGAFLGRNTCLSYNVAGNFNRNEGTVMLWFRPEWSADFTDRLGRIIWDLRIEHGSVVPNDPSQRWAVVFPNPADKGRSELRRWRFCVAVNRNQYEIGTERKRRDSRTRQAIFGTPQSFGAGKWMHLAVTWTPEKGAVFVDAEPDGVSMLEEGIPDKPLPEMMQLGALESWINAGAMGMISDFRIYCRVLTAAEIKHKAGRARNPSVY